MYKVNIHTKSLKKLIAKSFSELNLKERFDIQEWVSKEPSILGEDLLIIAKELDLPSKIRLDLLALDRQGNLVIIELKRDNSGNATEWQAVKYASYCSIFSPERIIELLAKYEDISLDEAHHTVEEFLETEFENINNDQRLILVSKEFHSDVASAVLWLRDYGIDIKCVRLRPFVDDDGDLFISPDIIIPLPEAKDYIESKEAKLRENKISNSERSVFSTDVSEYKSDELEKKLRDSLTRKSDLSPRLICFLNILLEEDRLYEREEIKTKLFQRGIGYDMGQTGRYMSNISQFINKPSTPHIRQVLFYDSAGLAGDVKTNYQIKSDYRGLVSKILNDIQMSPSS